jgi:hypothetical protein
MRLPSKPVCQKMVNADPPLASNACFSIGTRVYVVLPKNVTYIRNRFRYNEADND